MAEVKHYFLHVDLDAFFASVEQLDHPEYKGKPVIVGGKPEDRRSVVSTASYEARVFGVHSAMPVAKAYQLCPQGIFVHGRMKRYSELSCQIMEIFNEYSPDVQQISIDEAFIDLTGTEKLFGPPEETAKKIKARVKQDTGLTVSVGLAPTKYLAKIASDMNKPDGLYCINHGEEEAFMLKLPLKKVWGIGDKTQAALKSKGIKSTRDIHERSLESLTFMFGQSTGNFLYNAVRGIEPVDFDRKAKSHSISNERTFPYDLTDSYDAETVILELCHSVMFRLLKEKACSRTVMVKIRYEDFTTVSIQETYSQYILTLDSLFSHARELFEHKYERGRGIRLIGIGLENVDTEQKPVQQSLFDDGSEKIQKVENAILKLEQKHPGLKIHKARMLQKLNEGLKAFLIFLTGLLFFCITPSLNAQIYEDQESSYSIKGYWKGDLKGNVSSTFGYSNPFEIKADLPVFNQEIDLSALVNITKNFYFSMDFLDQFKHNSYTLGYKSDGIVREFKLSNRGITFPQVYSSSLLGYETGGGENQAPGLMLHLEDKNRTKWQADFLLRYDMLNSKSAVFYGNNSIKEITRPLSSFLHSQCFYIPSDVIADIKDIYIQNSDGNYKDSDGISYNRLSSQEYLIIKQQGLLYINKNLNDYSSSKQPPYILLTFFSQEDCKLLLKDTGTYDDPDTFAGQIQAYFGSKSQEKIKLSSFSSLTEKDMTSLINGEKAFIIQSPLSFSPYACSNLYALNSSSKDFSIIDFFIRDKRNDSQRTDYSLDIADEEEGLVQISKVNQKYRPSSPQYRFPFADEYPLLYLSGRETSNLLLVQQNMNPVKEYDIGKFVQAASVRVYRNGIIESSAIYNPQTGFVSLEKPALESDKIYITWKEESDQLSQGSFAAALGYVYKLNSALTFDISYTGFYPLLLDTNYFIVQNKKQSFSALSSGISFSNGPVTIKDAVSLAYEKPDMAKALLVKSSKMAETEKSKDSLKLNLAWDFSKGEKPGQKQSAVFEIPLDKAENLYRAEYFEIKILPGPALKNEELDVYLILGSLEEGQKEEAPSWKINSLLEENVITSLDLSKEEWQTVKIKIPGEAASKIRYSKKAEILIEEKAPLSGINQKGILYAGPYTITSTPAQLIYGSSVLVNSNIVKDLFSPSHKNYFSSTSYALDLQWNLIKTAAQKEDKSITSLSDFSPASFSDYKKICFDFALTSPLSLEYCLLSQTEEKALSLILDSSLLLPLCNEKPEYHTLTIESQSHKVYLDDLLLSPSSYELFINENLIPCREKITLIPAAEYAENPQSGHFYISNLYYKDTSSSLALKNLTQAYIKFNSGFIQAQSEEGINITEKGRGADYLKALIKASYSLWNLTFSADADSSLNAGHLLQSSQPLFNFFDFGEIYRFSKASASSQKTDYIKFNTKSLYEPFSILFNVSANARENSNSKKQGYAADLTMELNLNKSITSLSSRYKTELTTNHPHENNTDWSTFNNYFVSWYDTSKTQFTDGKDASKRNTELYTSLKTEFNAAGLSPSIEYSLKGNKTSLSDKAFSTLVYSGFTLPFSSLNNALSFSLKHEANLIQNKSPEDYGKDLSLIFQNQNFFNFYYRALPFYELAEKQSLYNKIRKDLNSAKAISISDSLNYELVWKRRLFNDLKDFFIPLSAGAGISRNLNMSDSSVNDLYQLKINAASSFINLFGSDSIINFFNWYKQEEFSADSSFIISFAANSKIKPLYSLNSNFLMTFYTGKANTNDTISLKGDFSLDNKSNFKLKNTLSYKRNVSKSLLLSLTKLCWPGSDKVDFKSFMTDSFILSLANSKTSNTQIYEYCHDSEILFLDNCSISSGAGLLFSFEKNKAFKLALEYSLGIKLSF